MSNLPGDDLPSGYGYGYGPPTPVRPPDHPRAMTAMVLGIVALAGGMICYFPALLAPVAWVIGGKAVREIDASHGQLGGRGAAQAGHIMGIIGTAVLGVVLLVIAGLIAFVIIGELTGSSTY